MTTLLKLGGELLEGDGAPANVAHAVARLASQGPLVVVHGGGRAIDAEMKARGQSPLFVDGLRVTDAAALDVVVSVLAGRTNTALVAALNAAGLRAIGLTGADAGIGRASVARRMRSSAGVDVDLGRVGEPDAVDVTLLRDLLRLGYLPTVASIGATFDGTLLNVNADTLASRIAVALRADRLLIAGTTPGVLDSEGSTVACLSISEIDEMVGAGVAHSGMVAKLNACRYAVVGGVPDVAVVGGCGALCFSDAVGTHITAQHAEIVDWMTA
jgi:acetylglutamate kinase